MAITVDNLQIEIEANANNASNSIRSLTSALERLKETCRGGLGLRTVAREVIAFNQALETGSIKAVKNVAKSVKSTVGGIQHAVEETIATGNEAVGKLPNGCDTTTKAVEETSKALASNSSDLKKNARNAKDASDAQNKIAKATDKAGKSAKKSSGHFGQLFSSLKRIAMYRLIRTAMKEIGQAFKEGLENAYQFSKMVGGSLSKSLDTTASASAKLKNQLGASLGALLESAMPAITTLINGLNILAETLTKVFAAFNGASTYLKAKDISKAWSDASDGLGSYNKQLQKFDELNNLSQSSGSGSSTNYKDMFEEAKLPEEFTMTANKIKDLAGEIVFNVKDFFTNWDNLSEKDIVKKVCEGIGGICGGLIGWSVGGAGGAIIGTLLGVGMGGVVSKFLPFDYDGKLSKKELYSCISPAIDGLIGGALGFSLAGIKGGVIGATLGLSIGFIVQKMRNSESNIALTKKQLFSKMKDAFTVLFSGIIGFAMGGSKGAFIAMSLSSALTFGLDILNEFTSGTSESAASIVKKLAPALNALFSGFLLVSGKYSGARGALLDISLIASIGMMIGNTLFKDGEISVDSTMQTLVKVLGTTFLGVIGFAIGGPGGAKLGLSIGAAISLVIGEVHFDWAVNGWNNIKSWVDDNILNPISDALGFDLSLNGFDNDMANIGLGIKELPSSSSSKQGSLPSNNQGVVITKPSGSTVKVTGSTNLAGLDTSKIKKYASGGVPSRGTLFYAGENGAEFVGSMGSSSAVANSGQMAEAIERASYRGMARALQENGGADGYEVIWDSQKVFGVMRKEASNYTKRTGNVAFS